MFDPREKGDLITQIALSLTFILFIVLFLGVKVSVNPYVSRGQRDILMENIQEKLEEIQLPQPPPKPKLPVEIEEAEEEEEENVQETIQEGTAGDVEIDIPLPEPGQVFNEFEVEEKPVLIKKVEPEYPEVARKLGIQGTAKVLVIVGPDGRVVKIEKIFVDNEIFREPVERAALQCLFKPAKQAGIPVSVRVVIPFIFRLTK
ncbi:MAG: energy transducer TonB [Candidatus Hydrothermales bacterium]